MPAMHPEVIAPLSKHRVRGIRERSCQGALLPYPHWQVRGGERIVEEEARI